MSVTDDAAHTTGAPAVAVTQTVTADTAPPAQTLLPNGVPAGQEAFTPNAEQLDNVKVIVDMAADLVLAIYHTGPYADIK